MPEPPGKVTERSYAATQKVALSRIHNMNALLSSDSIGISDLREDTGQSLCGSWR